VCCSRVPLVMRMPIKPHLEHRRKRAEGILEFQFPHLGEPRSSPAGTACAPPAGCSRGSVHPQVHAIHAGQVPAGERPLLVLPGPGQPRDHRAGQPAPEPRNWPSPGTKSPLDRPCRHSSGSTSDPLQCAGDLIGDRPAGAGGVECVAQQGPAHDAGIRGFAMRLGHREGDVVSASTVARRHPRSTGLSRPAAPQALQRRRSGVAATTRRP
jgi:hypothetical protein